MKKNISTLLIIFTVLLSIPIKAHARIKLTALPERKSVLLKLNSNKPTLVEEERVLSLQKGTNYVDFSWKGVAIDSNSIRIKIISHPSAVKLKNVSYPPNENALIWQIYCEEAFSEKVRISYLLHNIDSLLSYTALAEKDETHIDLKIYAVLRNFSGEELEDAFFKLDFGPQIEADLSHEETKRILLSKSIKIPIKKEFTFDSRILPWDPKKEKKNVGIPLRYVFKNDTDHRLGKFILDPGKVRVFQKDGHKSQIFIGEDTIKKRTYKGDEIKLYVGDSRDIVVTQKLMKSKKTNIRRNNHNSIILYDIEEKMSLKIENFKKDPCELQIIEYIPGEWEMKKTTEKYEKKNSEKIVFTISLDPKEKREFTFNYIKKNLR
ncbi:MAG: hypothetical protein KAI43_12995 [Candidatus Aureabacteria bacterium]|nr:hypothetical protein [Candidatus Auribacterota bacterium]